MSATMEQSTSLVLRLPDGTRLDARLAREVVDSYFAEHAPVLDLYDGTNPGPHDDVLPIDLLALNALNGYFGTAPMTPMSELWQRAAEIRPHIAAITVREIFDLTEAELAAEIPKIVRALEEVGKTRGYRSGGTRAAK